MVLLLLRLLVVPLGGRPAGVGATLGDRRGASRAPVLSYLSRATAGPTPASGGPGSSICPPGSTVTAVPDATLPTAAAIASTRSPGNRVSDVVKVGQL